MPQAVQADGVIRENISILDARIAREAEKRIPMMQELALLLSDRLAARGEESVAAVLAREAAMLPSPTLHGEALPSHREALSLALSALSPLDASCFLEALEGACLDRGLPLSPADFADFREPPNGRIAYLRNPYADEAYEAFAAMLPDPGVLYCESFAEVCEAVADARCGYAILPFENTAGLLRPFSELAGRYSLHMTALYRVFHADGTDATRFALYTRYPCLRFGGDAPGLRASFAARDSAALSLRLLCLSHLGARFSDVACVPDTAGAGALRCTVSLRAESGTATRLLTYLTMFTEDPVLHGYFKEIER